MPTLPRPTLSWRSLVAIVLLLSLSISACSSDAASTVEEVDGSDEDDQTSTEEDEEAAQIPPTDDASVEEEPTEEDSPTSEPSEEDVQIELATSIVWESYNYGTASLGGEGTQQLIDEFEALHPDITIEPIGTSAGEIHTSIQAAVAAGNAPDVAQIGWSKWPFVLENLPWVAIEDIAPSPEAYEEHIAGLIPATLEIGQNADGQQVGLPYTLSTATMMFNRDLFTAAGLDPDAPPATWEEAEAAALAIVEATDAEGVYVNAANEARSDFITQTLVNSNGGHIMDEEGNVTFDSPEAIEAIGLLGQLTGSGAQPVITESEATALFEAGQLGMYVTSTALIGGLIASTEGVFELDTAGIPAFGDLPVGPTNSGGGLFVFADDPARQAAAWEVVTFLTGRQGLQTVTEVIGYLPLRPDMVDDPAQLGPFFEADDRLLPAMQQLDTLTAYQFFSGENATQARELLQDEAVSPIMFSGADPEQTLTTIAAEVRSLLGQE